MAVDIDRESYIKLHRRAMLGGFLLGGAVMMMMLFGYVTWMQQGPGCWFALILLACPIAGPAAAGWLFNRLYCCSCLTCGRRLMLNFEWAGRHDAGWYKLRCPACGVVHRESK